jgi:SAM-dependent methyltransferase
VKDRDDELVEHVRRNRTAWNVAGAKYVVESDDVLEQVRDGQWTLLDEELQLLEQVLDRAPVVVHLQSGMGTDDIALAANGAALVIGVDFGEVTTRASAERARALDRGDAVTYVVADALDTPLTRGCADLVYTGKGALMWLPDLTAWAREAARLLRPGGHFFLYEAHPAAPLWTDDPDEAGLRADVDYFGGRRENDTFPATAIARFGDDDTPAAVEFQWPLAVVVNALLAHGFVLVHLGEYPEPFWKPRGHAAAWDGRLPNAFSLLARRAD